MEIIAPREVALGSDEGVSVRRTLPTRSRSLIGAWCFLDHYGPRPVVGSNGMSVRAHPHTGLQTVSWLFAGEIQHRDSSGAVATVVPGELNLMTAGRGISHSEMSTARTSTLHGVQMWLALPDSSRWVEPGFEHYAPSPVEGYGLLARVFLGSLLGSTSPVRTHSSLLGAELQLTGGTTLQLEVDRAHEHGILLDSGAISVDEQELDVHQLAFTHAGPSSLTLRAREDSRLLIIGGEPLGEAIVMWWNFIGRSHEEIVRFREQWNGENASNTSDARQHPVFGWPEGDTQQPVMAPELPPVRLRSRS